MRPYGYENDRITVREHEASYLRDAAERLLDGDSLRAVTTKLNEAGARTPGGNTWQPNVLRRVLMSPRVAGRVKARNGKLRQADWPAILDETTWKRLSKLLGDKSRIRGGASGTRVYLLTGGLARCGLCGKPLVARPNNDGRRGYVCSSGAPYDGCGKIRIVAELFERDVVERILARLLRDDARERLQEAVDSAQTRAVDAPAVILSAEQRLAKIGVDYADGLIGATELRAARERLTTKIRDARTAIRLGDMLANVAAQDAEDLVAWWEGASLEQQRALLDVLVAKVEVYPVRVRGSKNFDPSRVKLTWRRW